jgi:type IV pilus assembly protein PilB
MAKTAQKRLGDILLEQELVDADQLTEAMAHQRRTGKPLPYVFVELGYVSEEDIVVTLSEQLQVPHLRVDSYRIPLEVIGQIPAALARQYQLIPVSVAGNTLTIAMSDPLNIMALDDLKMLTGHEIEVVVSLGSEIRDSIDKYYGQRDGEMAEEEIFDDLLQQSGGEDELEMVVEKEEVDLAKVQVEAEEAPIVRLANLILANAIESGASDVHIEPFEKRLRVRYRIDGKLEEEKSPPKNVQAALTSRFKIMCDMDIAEHRVPQDARFRIKYKGREIDFRVSILPTYHGEKMVMRILDKGALSLDLEQLGFEEQPYRDFMSSIQSPYGIILVTGPTGSGKTTTLYSALHYLNNADVNIVTVEDPVEYELFGVNQVHVHAEIGLTFASALRSILRQDPDIVMVGEMRDEETADIAIKAALTGHLVLSTLHANDAPSVVTRLTDMGMEPFLIASSLKLTAAQRLMRRICNNCKEEVEVPKDVLKRVQYKPSGGTATFYRGRGCKRCKDSGYKGRLAVIEVMPNSEEIEDLIMERASATALKQKATELGMRTLRQNALEKAVKGLTTLEEVLRITAAD